MQILFWFYLGSGILLIVLSLPLLAMKIKPNPFYGFRVKITLNNPELWYEINHYFAKWQLAVGLTVVMAATGLFFWPGMSVNIYALVCLAVFGISFTVAILRSIKFMKEAKARK
jgi:CDP-diglyceride synthetase